MPPNAAFLAWFGIALTFAALRVWVLVYHLAHLSRTDFVIAYASAKVLLSRGWAAVYDPAQLAPVVIALTGGSDAQVATPLMILIAVPFSPLPPRVAEFAWLAVLVALLGGAWWLAAPGTPSRRIALLAGGIGLFPVFFLLAVENGVAISAFAIAAGWVLLGRGRPVAAGLVLAACVLKPQDVVLLPLALLLGGRRLAALAMAAGMLALVLAAAAALGPDNVPTYLAQVAHVSNSDFFGLHALAHWFHGPWRVVEWVVVVALVTVACVRHRASGPEVPIAAGLLGSMMVTPYLNVEDFVLLVVAGWLLLQANAGWRFKLALALTWLVFQVGFFISPPPVLLAEVAWLAWLALGPVSARAPVVDGPGSGPTPRAAVSLTAKEI